MNWNTVATALICGGVIQLIAAFVALYTKKKDIVVSEKGLTVTEDTSIRASLQAQVSGLMEERKTIVADLDHQKDRCDKLEARIQDAGEQILTYRAEVFDLTNQVKDAKEEAEHLRKQLEALTDAQKKIAELEKALTLANKRIAELEKKVGVKNYEAP